jgi:magnesium-protoporphyrin IX monomethyl ester (oxidative) cyclase
MGRKWRPRTPENVIKEIEMLVNEYNVGELGFEDDNFTFDMERAYKICDMMIQKGFNKKFKWLTPNGIRADKVDERLLKKFKESGCEEVTFAPESGNQWVVNNIIKKNLDLQKVEEGARICKEIGLRCGMFFVIGLPGETKEQINDTVEFAKRMKKDYGVIPMLFTAWPYYGTEMYKICVEKGYLTKTKKEDFEWGLVNEEPMIKTPEFTPEDLVKIRHSFSRYTDLLGTFELITTRPKDSLKLFVLRPKYIIKHFIRLLTGKNIYLDSD